MARNGQALLHASHARPESAELVRAGNRAADVLTPTSCCAISRQAIVGASASAAAVVTGATMTAAGAAVRTLRMAAETTSDQGRRIISTLAKLLVHGRPVQAGALPGADPTAEIQVVDALRAWAVVPIPLLSQRMGLARDSAGAAAGPAPQSLPQLVSRRGGVGQAYDGHGGAAVH